MELTYAGRDTTTTEGPRAGTDASQSGLPAAAAAVGKSSKRAGGGGIATFKNDIYGPNGIAKLHTMILRNPTIMYPPPGTTEAFERAALGLYDVEAAAAAVPSMLGRIAATNPSEEEQEDSLLNGIESKYGGGGGGGTSSAVAKAAAVTSLAAEDDFLDVDEFMDTSEEGAKVRAQRRERSAIQQRLDAYRKSMKTGTNSSSGGSKRPREDQEVEGGGGGGAQAEEEEEVTGVGQIQDPSPELATYHHKQLDAFLSTLFEFNHATFVKFPMKDTLKFLQRCGKESFAHLSEFEHHKRMARQRDVDALDVKRQAKERKDDAVTAFRSEYLESQLEEATRRQTQLEEEEAATTGDTNSATFLFAHGTTTDGVATSLEDVVGGSIIPTTTAGVPPPQPQQQEEEHQNVVRRSVHFEAEEEEEEDAELLAELLAETPAATDVFEMPLPPLVVPQEEVVEETLHVGGTATMSTTNAERGERSLHSADDKNIMHQQQGRDNNNKEEDVTVDDATCTKEAALSATYVVGEL